ncbi:hypothetical protein AC622_06820 [Bacillus sp. FJAT-27916]|nr:hypothetical protein AC622_06820 [Bacillus sp. FJAT-27916]
MVVLEKEGVIQFSNHLVNDSGDLFFWNLVLDIKNYGGLMIIMRVKVRLFRLMKKAGLSSSMESGC